MVSMWPLLVSLVLPGVTATVTSVQQELTPTSLIRVLDPSAAATLEEQTTANASTTLSNTSLSDLQNDNGTRRLQLRYRERKKQERLFHIQSQILQRLGISRQPNITLPLFSDEERRRMTQIFERMRHMRSHPQMNEVERPLRLYAARMQSFYPSCTLPNNTERESWEDPSSFRIFYDIAFPRPSSSTEISIMSAKLRIYKMKDPDTDPNFVGWETDLSSLPRYNLLDTLINSRASNGISISVYQYIKPLRLNRREKKRLVDSRTIPADHRGWIELNITSSLVHWFHNRNKNYGVEIEVEDAFGNKLNPFNYFRNMNCSSESVSQDPPFPNIMEIHPEMGENESSLFDNETYPTLDLQTAELTREEPTVQATEMSSRLLRKRHTGISHKSHRRPHGRCRREQSYVSFRQLGLNDIVVAPVGFRQSFCTGSCFSHHTSWFRLSGHERHWKKHSTCVPSQYTPLFVIFFDDEGQLRGENLQDIVVKECSCSS